VGRIATKSRVLGAFWDAFRALGDLLSDPLAVPPIGSVQKTSAVLSFDVSVQRVTNRDRERAKKILSNGHQKMTRK
jgi:hypothetical protein